MNRHGGRRYVIVKIDLTRGTGFQPVILFFHYAVILNPHN
jgi:hypothetical protein